MIERVNKTHCIRASPSRPLRGRDYRGSGSRRTHAAPAPRQALAQAVCRVCREAASMVSSEARPFRFFCHPTSSERCGLRPPQRRRMAAPGSSRAQDKDVSALSRGLGFSKTHPPPVGPRRNPDCAVLETRKAHSACCPQGSGQKPPPSAARHDRGPLIPAASAPVVCRCRNLAAFKTGPARHPCFCDLLP